MLNLKKVIKIYIYIYYKDSRQVPKVNEQPIGSMLWLLSIFSAYLISFKNVAIKLNVQIFY